MLVEGGGATLASFFEAGVVDRVCVFLAPRIFGAGPPAVEGAGFPLARAPRLSGVEVERLGNDVMVTGALAAASRRSR